MKYSVLIVNYNLKDSVTQLIRDLELHFSDLPVDEKFEVLVFDNASTDGSRDFFESIKFQSFRYFYSEKNLGFGVGMNRLAREARGKFLILLNPDLKIPHQKLTLPEWIASSFKEDRVLMVPALMGTDQKPQANGGGKSGFLTFVLQALRIGSLLRQSGLLNIFSTIFAMPGLKTSRYGRYFDNFRNSPEASPPEQIFDWASGAFWVVKRSDFEAAGGFDENIFLYCEDEDLCRRLKERTGRLIVKSNLFKALHAVEGSHGTSKRFSRGRLERLNSNIYVLRKWQGPLSSGALRIFYFFYFLCFLELKYAFQSLAGLRISDSFGSR